LAHGMRTDWLNGRSIGANRLKEEGSCKRRFLMTNGRERRLGKFKSKSGGYEKVRDDFKILENIMSLVATS